LGGMAGNSGPRFEAEDAHALGDTAQIPTRSSGALINNDVGVFEVGPIGILEVLPFVIFDVSCWNDAGCWDADGPQVIDIFLAFYDEDCTTERDRLIDLVLAIELGI